MINMTLEFYSSGTRVVLSHPFHTNLVNAWNGLARKVVAVNRVDKFNWDLGKYLDALQIQGLW